MPYEDGKELEMKVRYLNSFYSIDKKELEKRYNRDEFIRIYSYYELNEIKDKLNFMLKERGRRYRIKNDS